jgi:D-arabinose 1-dehydrogenase-like Zn-dependent alcohol dehydrogenase
MYKAKAYSAAGATSPLASTTVTRRDPTEHDVQIDILFCGRGRAPRALSRTRSAALS